MTFFSWSFSSPILSHLEDEVTQYHYGSKQENIASLSLLLSFFFILVFPPSLFLWTLLVAFFPTTLPFLFPSYFKEVFLCLTFLPFIFESHSFLDCTLTPTLMDSFSFNLRSPQLPLYVSGYLTLHRLFVISHELILISLRLIIALSSKTPRISISPNGKNSKGFLLLPDFLNSFYLLNFSFFFSSLQL